MKNDNGNRGLSPNIHQPYIWVLLAIAALLVSVGASAAPQDPLGKIGDERAMTMLTLVRQRLTELGVTNPQKTIGLEFGYYAGCRVFILEHLFVDGCIGFRVSEEIHAQVEPERLKQIVEDICRTDACPYKGEVAMTVRYFKETIFPRASDGSVTGINTQVGDRVRYRIKGGEKQRNIGGQTTVSLPAVGNLTEDDLVAINALLE